MEISDYPPEVQKFLYELLKHRVISRDALSDKTLINYLYSQRFDEDYIDSMKKNKGLGRDNR